VSRLIADIRGLSVHFGEHLIVDGIDFSIQENEILALVGESGCGKSTVALSLLRLLPDKGCTVAGKVLLGGRDILTVPENELNDLRGSAVSIIFQDPSTALNPVWSIGSQIVETLRRHRNMSAKAARRHAIELLDLVAIPDPHRRIDDFPHQFSGGMRQRVMIAMAISCNPRLLVADEPTTALDVTTQAQVLELLDKLRRDLSMSILLITHDLSLVADWADRVVVMYGGQICESAPTRSLFSAPFHPYTQCLLASIPPLSGGPTHRTGRLFEGPSGGFVAASAAGCRYAARCDMAEASCLSAKPAIFSVRAGSHLAACPVVKPSVSLAATVI
jgi:peptide/nickel transport system ATP-binding protein